MFGAPEAHEDDPERAVRAAFRALSAEGPSAEGGMPALRIGVETGPAVLGPIGGGARVEYGAVGDVVGLAAALQSRARPGSALVGPVTQGRHRSPVHLGRERRAGGRPGAAGRHLPGQAQAPGAGRRLRLGGRGPLVGRQAELAVLGTALRERRAATARSCS